MKRTSITLFALLLAAIVFWRVVVGTTPFPTAGLLTPVKLTRGEFTVLNFPASQPNPAALIIFASGDGGWGKLEEGMARTLQARSYEVIGIDSTRYADTDYDLTTLQSDIGQIAQTAEGWYGTHSPPLIIGGYSMGAAQAIAAAGGPHPPAGLIGLLVVDPCSRGRYGLRSTDRFNLLPTGPGTFSMKDFARSMETLRVVQWHAAADSIDSRAWLNSLTAPYKEFDFPVASHNYRYDRENFLRQFGASVEWILDPVAAGPMTARTKRLSHE